jgi:hypothetical protein
VATNDMWRKLVLFGIVLACSACQASTEVGSACRHGVCPQANAVATPPCLVSAETMRVSTMSAGLHAICLARTLTRDAQGNVSCDVDWSLPSALPPSLGGAGAATPSAGTPASCSERPFLERLEDDQHCRVRQLAVSNSTPVTDNGDGWYYDGGPNPDCVGSVGSVQFTEGAFPPDNVLITVNCDRTQKVDDHGALSDVEANQCSLPADSAKHAASIGTSCMPDAVPGGGFDEREAYVETGSTQCDTGACLVYHLRGDPSNVCGSRSASPECVAPAAVKDRVYCSCRCDAPAGDSGALCACKEGFSCVDVLDYGPAGIRGSYCVRNATTSLSSGVSSGQKPPDAAP